MHDAILRRICERAADAAFRKNFHERCTAERTDTADAAHADDDDAFVDSSAYESAALEAQRAQRAQIAHQDALWRTPLGDAAARDTQNAKTDAVERFDDEFDSGNARAHMVHDFEEAWRKPLV